MNAGSTRLFRAATRRDGRPLPLRAAFTILELVLALAVIAVVMGLAWPVMLRFSAEHALKENVEQVRSRLARTRLLTIGAGLTYQFRYEPGGRRCLTMPLERPLGASGGSNATGSAGAVTGSSGSATQTQALVLELAEGLRFLSSPPGPAALTQPDAAERVSEDMLTMFGAPTSLAQVGWSKAIPFRPDGTSQDTTFVVADADGRYQVLSVRGLTAAVSVGPIERERRR
ncbi:MAG: hypothetical protein U0992_15535 [Planctomycetaceae bacterium]